MLNQNQFLASLVGEANQKTFKILDPKSGDDAVRDIDISVFKNQQEPGDSSAEGTGNDWLVQVGYSMAPEVTLYSEHFSNEKTARDLMEDFSKLAAEIEGLIKSEDFQSAKEQSAAFEKKCSANTGAKENPAPDQPEEED